MGTNFLVFVTAVFALAAGCRSMEKSADGSASLSAKSAPTISQQVVKHQRVIVEFPKLLSQQVRENDLSTARMTAETMYQTLQALETDRGLEAQVCFGGSAQACSNFRHYMSQDIKSLYQGFVLSNTLTTGELLKIASQIEYSSSLQYR